MIPAHPRARLGRQLARDFQFSLPGEWAPLLNRRAAEAGMSRSNYVRQIVLRELGVILPNPELTA